MAGKQSPEVVIAKRDLAYLKSILRTDSNKTAEMHAACPICGDRTCLQFGPDKSRVGEWFWHCHKGCGGGDLVDAIMKVEGLSFAEAFKKIRNDFSGRVPKSERDEYYKNRASQQGEYHNGSQNGQSGGYGINPYGSTAGVVQSVARLGNPSPQLPAPRAPEQNVDPVLDLDAAEKFITEKHNYLMNNFHLSEKWQRGLSREVCEKYRIGFIEFGETKFAPWHPRPMEIPAAWVLPITDAEGVVKGVKAHFEERPFWGGKQCPKSLWMPFGTVPAYEQVIIDGQDKPVEIKPRHSYVSMWPHPDVLCPSITDDFSLDASYWIQRIPAELMAEWNDIVFAQGAKYAFERSKAMEDMDAPDCWEVKLLAFDEMKTKIFKAVMKSEERSAEQEARLKKNSNDWDGCIFVCPGELKALACESAGMMATAPTGGESSLPSAAIMSRFAGQRICLLADEDIPKQNVNGKTGKVIKTACAGRDWAMKWTSELLRYGAASVVAKFGGQRSKG